MQKLAVRLRSEVACVNNNAPLYPAAGRLNIRTLPLYQVAAIMTDACAE